MAGKSSIERVGIIKLKLSKNLIRNRQCLFYTAKKLLKLVFRNQKFSEFNSMKRNNKNV